MFKKTHIVLLVAAFLAAPCFGEETAPVKKMDLPKADGVGIMKVEASSTFNVMLPLPENPQEDYKWQLMEEPDPGLVKLLKVKSVPIVMRDPGRIMKPHYEEAWNFRALKSGEVKLIFVYSPEGRPGESVRGRQDVLVKIDE